MTYSDSDTVSTTSTASSAEGVNCRHGLEDSYDLDMTYDLEHMQHQGNSNEATDEEQQHQHGCYIDNISRLNPSYTVDDLYRLYPATDLMEEEMAYQHQVSTLQCKKKNDDGIITGCVVVQVDLEQSSTAAAAAAAAAAMVSVAMTSTTTTDFQSLLAEELLDLRNEEKQKRLMLGVRTGIATTTREEEEQQQPAKKKGRLDYTDSPSRLFATRIPEDEAVTTPLVIPVSFLANVEVEEEDDDEVGDAYDAFSTITISPSTISEDESVAPPAIPVSDIHSIANGEEEIEGDDDVDVDEDDNIPTTSTSSLAAISEEDKDVVASSATFPVSNSSITVNDDVNVDVNVNFVDDDDITTPSTSSLPVISEEEDEVVAPSATIPVSVSFIAVNGKVVGNIDDEATAAMVAVASNTEKEAALSTLPTGSDTSSFHEQVTATLYNKNSTMSDEEKNKRIVDLLRGKYGDTVATSYNTQTSTTATSPHTVWCDFVCEHRIQFQDVSNNEALDCEDALMEEAEMNYDYRTHSFKWWWNPLDDINTNNQRMAI